MPSRSALWRSSRGGGVRSQRTRATTSLVEQAQEAPSLREEEVEIGEGFEADILPPHPTLAIHQEDSVQARALEIIVGMPLFEGGQRRIRRERERHFAILAC
jgi:hypothetical protein